jgi:transposase
MEVVYAHCCGLDVHKKSVVGCVLTPAGKEIRTFGTTTTKLIALAEWLQAAGCTHVAMESTGVYWKPVCNLLEATSLQLLVVNAEAIKAVPGRKTDVKDSEWIADLLRHGLLRGSFIPARPQRELRELVRYRRALIQECAREVNRIQKVLEGANIKLGDVSSSVVNKSGRDMLTALIRGETDPAAIADLARGRLRSKRAALAEALRGFVGPHQQMLLALQLEHVEALEGMLDRLNQAIGERMQADEPALVIADTIPGVGRRIAEDVLAEIGTNMSRFPTAAHLAAWAGVCPGNEESAGKRQNGRARHGNSYVRSALIEAAHAAARTKETYLGAFSHRLAGRRGKKRAALAVAHAILVSLYHMLTTGALYEDLGPTHFDRLHRDRIVRRTVRRLEALGYKVSLEASPA